MSAPREPMDAFTAVFNGDINNADQRARDRMAQACPGYLAKVLKREKDGNGIMAIFDPPHFKAFKRYACLVQLYVNGETPKSCLSGLNIRTLGVDIS